jgi:hypothetical protein
MPRSLKVLDSELMAMTKFLTTSLACCLALTWSIGDAAAAAKPYAYSMKITVSRPKGSVAEASLKDKTQPSSTALTPCNDDLKQDVLSFQLVYDAGKITVNKDPKKNTTTVTDVYLFFYNPTARGADPNGSQVPVDGYPEICKTIADVDIACDPKIWALVRPAAGGVGSIAMEPFADASNISADNFYLSKEENLGKGKISESLLRSYMRFDDLQQGLWSLVGIVGPKTDAGAKPVDFKDPSTWAAWDVATFMLGSPWANDQVCK